MMNKTAYEHNVGMVLSKQANMWDDIVSHVKSNKDHYWRALGGGLIGGGLGYAISRKPVGILLGLLLGAGATGGISKWLSTPNGSRDIEDRKELSGIGKKTNKIKADSAGDSAVNAHLKWAINHISSPEKLAPTVHALYESSNPNNVINNHISSMNNAKYWDNLAVDKFKSIQEIPDHTSKEVASARDTIRLARDMAKYYREWSTDPFATSYNYYAYSNPEAQAERDRKSTYHINEAKSYFMPPFKNYTSATNR